MRAGELLSGFEGHWYGDSRMRMMPDDPFRGDTSAASLSVVAGGNAVTLSYDWHEPESGRQAGILLLGDGLAPGTVDAVWLDSRHQHPRWMAMTGTIAADKISVSGTYGDGVDTGGWHLHLHLGEPDTLVMTMDNVMSDTGQYEVVRAVWRRS